MSISCTRESVRAVGISGGEFMVNDLQSLVYFFFFLPTTCPSALPCLPGCGVNFYPYNSTEGISLFAPAIFFSF